MFVIYKITCKENGKFYIGKTCQKVTKRWTDHIADANGGADTYFKRAIRKYGKQAFVVTEVAWAANNDLANWLERLYIDDLGSNDPKVGYNSTCGGDGVSSPSGETLEKMIAAGRRHTSHTLEAKLKIKEASKRMWSNPEHVKKVREGMRVFFENRKQQRLATSEI